MKKDNMYSFITKRENPLCGECSHNCSYCYVKKLKKRYPQIMEKYSGKHRIDKKSLVKRFKPDDFVFVCTCNDLFAENVPENIIKEIISFYDKFECVKLFQTKNPKNIRRIMPNNSISCVTIESDILYKHIMMESPLPIERYYQSKMIRNPLYITIEPIMNFTENFIKWLIDLNPVQINIGADSGNNNLPEPPKGKILELINELEKFTIVHKKDNLNRLLK